MNYPLPEVLLGFTSWADLSPDFMSNKWVRYGSRQSRPKNHCRFGGRNIHLPEILMWIEEHLGCRSIAKKQRNAPALLMKCPFFVLLISPGTPKSATQNLKKGMRIGKRNGVLVLDVGFQESCAYLTRITNPLMLQVSIILTGSNPIDINHSPPYTLGLYKITPSWSSPTPLPGQ